jgi:hypothetical protein
MASWEHMVAMLPRSPSPLSKVVPSGAKRSENFHVSGGQQVRTRKRKTRRIV